MISYMKTRVSLFNDELVEKPVLHTPIDSFLKEEYFPKFSDLCLFYIFYYMTRDFLQVYAGQQLYKNGWKFHVDFQIWFKKGTEEDEVYTEPSQNTTEENTKTASDYKIYFNPLEWRKEKYVFEDIDEKAFLPAKEVEEYVTKLRNSIK